MRLVSMIDPDDKFNDLIKASEPAISNLIVLFILSVLSFAAFFIVTSLR
jgi:hypothetical protein